MSDKWKPSIAKMVLYTSKADETGQLLLMNIAVDPGTPKRWREKSYYIQIKRMALVGLHSPQKFLIRILVGKRQWISLPNKDVELIVDADFKVVQIVPGQWDIIQGDTNA